MKIFEVLSTLFSIELENHPASKKVSLFFVIVSLMTLRGKMNKFASFCNTFVYILQAKRLVIIEN